MTVHETEVSKGILQVTIDDRAKRNALSPGVLEGLAGALDRSARDDAVRVVVLTGAGDVFCSGGDTGSMGDERPGPWAKKDYLDRGVGRLARLFLALDKPVIAAVNGPAVGAGVDLMLWCDFRMAQPAAYLKLGFVDLGLNPGFGSAWHLTRLLGSQAALEILLTGRKIEAEEALRLGLFRSLSSGPHQLDADALEFAELLAGKSSPAVRATKRLVQRAASTDVLAHLEQAWAQFGLLQETPEHLEAVRARAARSAQRNKERQ
jgi:enoyl-CoA hydratase/carnithine racemase